MSLMIFDSIIILFGIIIIIYKFLLYPKIRLIQKKRKYGDKIKVIHHFGPGLLVEYKKSYIQNKDSLSFLRQMANQNGNNIQAYTFNIGTSVGYSFVDPDLIKLVHQNHEAFQKIDVSQAIAYLFLNLCYLQQVKASRSRANSQENLSTMMKLKTIFHQSKIFAQKSPIGQAKSCNEITIEEIIDNFCALFIAGTDTTGNMTGAALYFLSLNPKIQEEAREEVMQIIKQKTNSSDLKELYNCLQFEDLAKLDLINSIFKESLRLDPPASGVLPRISKQDIKIGQFEVKKGDLVNTHFIYNQSNPKVFINQGQINPYRWMKGKEQANVFNFTPFPQGPRNCIGQHLAMIEGKSILINFLLNFDIIPIPQKEVKYETKVIYELQPDELVYFRKRNN
ncbi:hypothetical protein ABPG72_000457 [Tetrahymena utriculariae]